MNDPWQKYVKRPLNGFVPSTGKPDRRSGMDYRLKVIFQRADGSQALCTKPHVSVAEFSHKVHLQTAIDDLHNMLPEIPADAKAIDAWLETPRGWYRMTGGVLYFRGYR